MLILLITIMILLFNACTQNIAYREGERSICIANECNNSLIEEHTSSDENYTLAFVEFSERGNVFNRDKFHEVLNYVEKENSKNLEKSGILLVVYAHGWKHNANQTGDVAKFREALRKISQANKNSGVSERKVIGVYIGWRGSSVDVWGLKELTYWARKEVAHQVGTGGVTELLVRLNKILYQEEKINNVFVVSGHSMGGAMILSAMKDILISHIINTKKDEKAFHQPQVFKELCKDASYKTKAFADSIVLLNPAVEANELVQLKSLMTEERCYSSNQPKLLHILSSEHDSANLELFSFAQSLGISLFQSQNKLNFKVHNNNPINKNDSNMKNIVLDESELDTTTVGNYPPFRTRKDINQFINIPCHNDAGFNKKNKGCVEQKDRNNTMPVSPFEPISVIYTTDKNFIENHSDISNEEILGYMTAAVIANQYKKNKNMANRMWFCFNNKRFDFGKCKLIFTEFYKNCTKSKKNCSEFKNEYFGNIR